MLGTTALLVSLQNKTKQCWDELTTQVCARAAEARRASMHEHVRQRTTAGTMVRMLDLRIERNRALVHATTRRLTFAVHSVVLYLLTHAVGLD